MEEYDEIQLEGEEEDEEMVTQGEVDENENEIVVPEDDEDF